MRIRLPKRSIPKWLVLTVILAEVSLLTAAVVTHKMEGGSFDGVTLCYPFRGPVQMFDSTLSDSAAILTRTHEAVHAEQCREMGAIRNFFARVTTKGRIRLEAQAYCAQARQEVSWGAKPSLVFDRIVEELAEVGVGRTYGKVDAAGIREIMMRECPDLVSWYHWRNCVPQPGLLRSLRSLAMTGGASSNSAEESDRQDVIARQPQAAEAILGWGVDEATG